MDELTPGSDGPRPTYGHGLRVAHVVTRYLRGGSERRVRDICDALSAAEHRVFVGAESDVALALRETHAAHVRTVPTLRRRPHLTNDLRSVTELARAFLDGSYDIVVTHQSKAGVVGRLAARRAGLPVIHSLSMPSFGEGYPRWQSAIFRRLERHLIASTDAYVVVGTDVARRYRRIGVPDDKTHIVRSGVRLPTPDDPEIDDADVRRSLDLPPRSPLIVYLGSLEPRKNVVDLAPMLDGVVRAGGERPHLVVAGDGALAGPLEKQLAELGLADTASLLGYVVDPLPLVRAAACVVLLSDAEGLPQVLVQAAASGTPFVAYDVDGVRELVDLGADGVVVPRGDIRAAAAAARSIVDREPSRRIVSIDVSPWSRAAIGASYRDVFSRVLTERRRAGSDATRADGAS
jgi:glycosyltransferase involved in cell wall biosynthesis